MYGTYSFSSYCLPNTSDLDDPELEKEWENMKQSFLGTGMGSVVMDLYSARWVILISIFLALAFSMLYVKTMDWCAFALSWVSVVLI